MSSGSERYRIGVYSIFFVLLLTGLYQYHNSFSPLLRADNTSLVRTVQDVHRHAKPEQLIVIRGMDWNPGLPFYSHRPAIMYHSFTPAHVHSAIHAASP